ncbi:hypothetical protein V1514DRAFT_321845 [Lipomyces japonicus]|uniref:uncharacterized protein n=1 Tax=Lipomyces japonicus TaxID=56871 RepID=UPI0034CED1CB
MTYASSSSKKPRPRRPLLQELQHFKLLYEVTLPLYVMTPGEQLVLNAFFCMCFFMLAFALFSYTPSHAKKILNRVCYYYTGVEYSIADPAFSNFASSDPVPNGSSVATPILGLY